MDVMASAVTAGAMPAGIAADFDVVRHGARPSVGVSYSSIQA